MSVSVTGPRLCRVAQGQYVSCTERLCPPKFLCRHSQRVALGGVAFGW